VSKAPTESARYESESVVSLLRLLQEATRATPQGGPQAYVPPTGGEIAEANYHHFIFGQRGSGKSSLLRHLQAQMADRQRASVWIDQEIFSNLNYPDVLVSAVLALMQGVLDSVLARVRDADVRSPTRWERLRRTKRKLTSEQHTVQDLRKSVVELEKLKFAPLDRKIEWVFTDESSSSSNLGGSVKIELVSLQAGEESAGRSSRTATEVVEGSKEQYLERALLGFRALLTRASLLVDGGFVFIDDLYQLRRADQPLVLGYMHRLVKDTGLWLKVGSIRYSTVTYRPGDPPRGMQVGHDAHEVPLDRGLRHFQSTQDFLEEILSRIAQPVEVDITSLLTPDARKRLVLAAGGVARDYLRLTSGAINEARNRGVTEKPGSHRVIVEDVNKAAGLLSPSKFDDLRKDEPSEAASLEQVVRQLTEFCRATKAAYFLLSTDDAELSDQVNKLQHLRFTHLLVESETVPNEGSQRFNVWFLDVAELSAQRATTGMDFLGWENREKRRNRKLIYVRQLEQPAAPTPRPPRRPRPRKSATPIDAPSTISSPADSAPMIEGDSAH
jgi:energy-coupling factor transporter ATP-binding protein EcfA2